MSFLSVPSAKTGASHSRIFAGFGPNHRDLSTSGAKHRNSWFPFCYRKEDVKCQITIPTETPAKLVKTTLSTMRPDQVRAGFGHWLWLLPLSALSRLAQPVAAAVSKTAQKQPLCRQQLNRQPHQRPQTSNFNLFRRDGGGLLAAAFFVPVDHNQRTLT